MESHAEVDTTAPADEPEVGNVPAWLALADEDERADLASAGVTLERPALPAGAAERAALASTFLRRLHYIERDIIRADRMYELEWAALQRRHDRTTMSLVGRRNAFTDALQSIAASFPFVGKAKSQRVGWGVFGVKKQPDTVRIDDEAAVLAWASAHAPSSVSFTLCLTLAEARELLPAEVIERGDVDIGRAKVKALLNAPMTDTPALVGASMQVGAVAPYFTIEPLVGVADGGASHD